MPTQTFTTSGTWTPPGDLDVAQPVEVQAWAEGGSGGSSNGSESGGGGGGGGYSAETNVGGITNTSTLTITIGTGSSSTNTTVTGGTLTVTANYGTSGTNNTTIAGTGGAASGNSISFAGSNGNPGTSGSGHSSGAGGNGSGPSGVGTGGAGGALSSGIGNPGTAPGGGGSGGGSVGGGSHAAGTGAHGQVIVTWSVIAASFSGVAAGSGTPHGIKSGSGSVKGAGAGSAQIPVIPRVVNQWSGTFNQPVVFGNTPPALESVVVALNSSSAVGFGSGIPTAGNWLFCIAGWNQQNTPGAVTVGVNDDIHSWWRPNQPSFYNASTRTTIWYTPNIASAPQYVYVAPSSQYNGMSVLIVEIAGIGPWDTVTGTNSNYAGGATGLTLALGVPSGTAFTIAGVCGDNDSATQAFAPSGWTTLSTVTATDGSDHLCDAVLTSAVLPATSGAISVSASSVSATDLSGFMLQVLQNAPSPIPAGHNPNWPYLFFEAGFSAGYETPLDQIIWTDLTSRLWDWDETTGVQYQLAQLRASDVTMELDNNDNYLASLNVVSPYYPNVQAGTPVRIRAALGTIGGVSVNRWYIIQKNSQQWPEGIDENWRRYSEVTAADTWTAQSAIGSTYYRGEVLTDNPYAWWTCDDQPKDEGVQPTSLANNALGNTNVLNIVLSPNGATLQAYHGTDGTTQTPALYGIAGSLANYATGVSPGWMWGDPVSTLGTTATGISVSQEPGSAAWQAYGQAGTTGSYGYFLSCNDNSYPTLAEGLTVEGWFNYTFLGSSAALGNAGTYSYTTAQQPVSVLSLLELATGSDPVAILQMDANGDLHLLTYPSGSSSSTSHSIYTTTDLRDNQWFHVALNLTETTFTVYVNGGLAAAVSGTMTASSPVFQWLIVNGDLGTNGGSSAGTGLVHGGNVQVSHLAIYPRQLPVWRILAHYDAAVASFGQIPAPSGVTTAFVQDNQYVVGYAAWAPDGTAPTPGFVTSSGAGGSVSALVAAVAGSYTSGPSARSGATYYDTDTTHNPAYVQWAGTADKFNVYTAASTGAETLASVVRGTLESYGGGYGNTSVPGGVGEISGGTGASPPSAASALGDTVGQRIERLIEYGTPGTGANFPNYTGRCIDPSPLLVKAPAESGQGIGVQTGVAIQEISQSDGGLLFVDNLNNLTYWMRSHLDSQYGMPVWTIGPDDFGASFNIPYYRQIQWISDPQRIWNAIEITPVSPGNALLPVITPSSSTAVSESQSFFGVQPLQIISWLQSTTEQQNQANWLFEWYGYPRRRAERVRVDASSYPAAWSLVLGVNVGDVVQLQDWAIGNTGYSYTYRVSQIHRHLSNGAHGLEITGSVELQLDWEPPYYWDSPVRPEPEPGPEPGPGPEPPASGYIANYAGNYT